MKSDLEFTAAIDGRSYCRRKGRAATGDPGMPGTVRVLPVAQPTRRVRFAAMILRGGRAEHTVPCGTSRQTVDWAETGRLS